jgi:DNA-directed RNA polymerase specialized sigma24 family protein
MNNSLKPTDYHLLVEALQKKELPAFAAFYDRYAAAFYGDIKRTLYKQAVSEQTLKDAFNSIWKSIPNFEPMKENLFTWSMKKVRKEISKKKVNILLEEIFSWHPAIS